MNMNRLIPPPDCDLTVWLSSVVYDAIRDAKTAGLSDSDASVLLDIIARNTRDSRSVDVRTPKLDAEIDRVNRERSGMAGMQTTRTTTFAIDGVNFGWTVAVFAASLF